MKFSFACVSAVLAPVVVVTARLASVTNDNNDYDNEHKQQDHPQQQQHPAIASPSSFSKVKSSTTYKKLADRLELRYEPNKIHNNDDVVKDDDNSNKDDDDDDDNEVKSSTPTTDSTSTSGDKEECVPPVTVNKNIKLDAGNLPLSSCSSSKKQICINKNSSSSSNYMKKSSSSIEKKTGVCTDINDVPNAYWGVGNPTDSSDIPSSYWDWEDTISTSAAHTNTITTGIGIGIEHYEPMYEEEDIRYYDHDRNLLESSGSPSAIPSSVPTSTPIDSGSPSAIPSSVPTSTPIPCDVVCQNSTRPNVSAYGGEFYQLIDNCIENTNNVTVYNYNQTECPYAFPINCWYTGAITNMDSAFANQQNFTKPLKCWDTSSVTSMQGMFYYTYDFNQPIGDWNTSKVTSMKQMFYYSTAFDKPIDEWDVSQVSNAGSLFKLFILKI
jgi:surface protein